MNAGDLANIATYHLYRWAGYALLNMADDVAMLAFMFC
jgi:hypothetical protein